jgi:hypothetical protein
MINRQKKAREIFINEQFLKIILHLLFLINAVLQDWTGIWDLPAFQPCLHLGST